MAGLFKLRRLNKNGRQAQAEVLEGRMRSVHGDPVSPTYESWDVKLRVMPEGEAPFEASTKMPFPSVYGSPSVGMVFPVVFDSDDHEQVTYDPEKASSRAARSAGRGSDAEAAGERGASERVARRGRPPPDSRRWRSCSRRRWPTRRRSARRCGPGARRGRRTRGHQPPGRYAARGRARCGRAALQAPRSSCALFQQLIWRSTGGGALRGRKWLTHRWPHFRAQKKTFAPAPSSSPERASLPGLR